jgi:uncharacterized membrane protein
MNDIMFIVIIILLMVLTWVLLPQFLYKRAIKKVIKIFNEYNAFSVESAKTPLGRNRDYKPRALQMLIDYKIILKTADDRVYLDKTQAALYKL